MEKITVKEATIIARKGEKTIRNWIRAGYIKKFKDSDKPNAKVYIDKDELLNYLVNHQSKHQETVEEVKAALQDRYIDRLEEEIDNKDKKITSLESKLDDANQRIAELTEKSHSLELELSKAEGVHVFRRLLKAVW